MAPSESLETSVVSLIFWDVASLSCASASKWRLGGRDCYRTWMANREDKVGVPGSFSEIGCGDALEDFDDDADPGGR